MEFYAVSQLVNSGELATENLTDEFFDFVYLGQGDAATVAERSGVSVTTLEKAKDHVNARYPVDVSIAGFEHISVHTPFSLFTHAAVLPENFFFPEYVVTAHITRDGEKMSKSKGNVVYLDDLLELTRQEGSIVGISPDSSLDAVRFFLSYYQNLDKDFDWNDDNYRQVGLKGMKRYVNSVMRAGEAIEASEQRHLEEIDHWFSTIDQRTVNEITRMMDEKDSRGALVELVDIRGKALNVYLASNPHPEILKQFLENQINMGYPVMPRVTEELRQVYIPTSKVHWPEYNTALVFPEEFERVEEQRQGKNYSSSMVGQVNTLIGKMIGRKEVSDGDALSVIAPTHHQIDVLRQQKIPFAKRFNLQFQVDSQVDGIEVRAM